MIHIPLQIVDGLPFVAVAIRANGLILRLEHVLLDTGSAGIVFRTDDLEAIGIVPLLTDRLRVLRGISGDETVVEKSIDAVEVGTLIAAPFTIELAAMEYDTFMDGILGFDFLLQTRAVIDFQSMQLRAP